MGGQRWDTSSLIKRFENSVTGTSRYYEDFKEIEKKIWSLSRAVNDRNSEFRTPVFICGNNDELDGRVVVLRKVDEKNSYLQFHSDIRSSKIEIIKKNPNNSLLFYGKKEKIQLRMKIKSEIHFDNQITKFSWERTGILVENVIWLIKAQVLSQKVQHLVWIINLIILILQKRKVKKVIKIFVL